jgi:hypothetical protein
MAAQRFLPKWPRKSSRQHSTCKTCRQSILLFANVKGEELMSVMFPTEGPISHDGGRVRKRNRFEPDPPRFASKEEFERFWNNLSAQSGDKDEFEEFDANQIGSYMEYGSVPVTEEAYDKLMSVLNNKPTNREVMRRTLVFCTTQRNLDEVEKVMQTYPEFPLVMQPPYRIVKFLIKGGGLVQYELDEEGKRITSERKAGLNENQIDDLIANYALQTTDVGKAVIETLDPAKRLRRSFEMFPDRANLFTELLEFCREPRTLADICTIITKDKIEGIKTYNYEPGCMMKPSVFIDNMEAGCGLVWYDHAWHTTEEGIQLLEEMHSAKVS